MRAGRLVDRDAAEVRRLRQAAREADVFVHAPYVEEPKRLRVAPTRNKKRLISMVIIDAHNQYIVKAGSL